MIIGGLEKLTLIDYPGKISAIVFVQGCNFRCQFCYNPMLVLPLNWGRDQNISPTGEGAKGHSFVKEEDLFHFLGTRIGKLDGVVISGGEPTIHNDLPEFIAKIKKLGFLVKLDTNGTNPEAVEGLIKNKLIDYIAMDLKSDKDNYDKIVGIKTNFDNIEKSVKIIINSGLPYEFRTTCVPGFHDEKIIANMSKIISGSEKWFLQKFKSDTGLIEERLEGGLSFTDEQMQKFADIGSEHVKICQVR